MRRSPRSPSLPGYTPGTATISDPPIPMLRGVCIAITASANVGTRGIVSSPAWLSAPSANSQKVIGAGPNQLACGSAASGRSPHYPTGSRSPQPRRRSCTAPGGRAGEPEVSARRRSGRGAERDRVARQSAVVPLPRSTNTVTTAYSGAWAGVPGGPLRSCGSLRSGGSLQLPAVRRPLPTTRASQPTRKRDLLLTGFALARGAVLDVADRVRVASKLDAEDLPLAAARAPANADGMSRTKSSPPTASVFIGNLPLGGTPVKMVHRRWAGFTLQPLLRLYKHASWRCQEATWCDHRLGASHRDRHAARPRTRPRRHLGRFEGCTRPRPRCGRRRRGAGPRRSIRRRPL